MAGKGNHDVVVRPPQSPHAPLGFGRTRPSAARHSSNGIVRSFKPSAEKVDRHIEIDPNKTGDEIRADMLRWLIERCTVIPEERQSVGKNPIRGSLAFYGVSEGSSALRWK